MTQMRPQRKKTGYKSDMYHNCLIMKFMWSNTDTRNFIVTRTDMEINVATGRKVICRLD